MDGGGEDGVGFGTGEGEEEVAGFGRRGEDGGLGEEE